MSLFLSTFCNKLDKKGRVSVPASFRTALAGQNFSGIIAFRSLNSTAIEGFGMDVIEKLSAQAQGFDPFPQPEQNWLHIVFAEAQQLPFDSEGRIFLPTLLREHAKLEDSIVFVGRGPVFQIWNPELFAQHQEEQRNQFIASKKASSPAASGAYQIVGGN